MDIYRQYGPAIARKCERMLRNRADAEDIVQALFVDLYSSGKTEVDLPYLYRAATNRCLNLIRDRKKRTALLERQGKDLDGLPPRTLLDEQAIGLELLCQLVAKLDSKASEILVYRYLDDLTQEEIAEVMGTTRKTVYKKLLKIEETVAALRRSGNGGRS